MSYNKYISLNGFLFFIVIFLSVWDILQIDKPSIPFSRVIYSVSLLLLYINKWERIKQFKYGNVKSLIWILVAGLCLFLVKGLLNEEYRLQISDFLGFFFVAVVLEKATKEELVLSRVFFVSFIAANCLAMIYERSVMKVIFWDDTEYGTYRDFIEDLTMFRASGFTGHPVLGGFLLSIELAFIQLSQLKDKWKYAFTILVFFALLCTNSRLNIVLSALVSLYLFKDALFSKRNRLLKILLIGGAFYFFYDLITTTDFGGRLMNMDTGKDDSSTMARFEVFSFTDYLNLEQLIWGDLDLVNHLMTMMGLVGLENGYIILILKYGLILGGVLIFFLVSYQWKALDVYQKQEKIILFCLFVVIANTNPHVGHQIPWTIWMICYYLFRPSNTRRVNSQ